MMRVRVSAIALAMGASTIAQAALAEDVPAAEDAVQEPGTSQDPNEIIVTGEKFDRTVQDTPTSVKVFTSEDIERQNLTNVFDVIERTANMSSGFGDSAFTIRGISNTNVSGTGLGDLATVYLDGSPLPREGIDAGPLNLWDLAQVEVLRGPQSTLQGRNALAGAIILRTADPTFEWTARARAIYTFKTDERRLAAAVGGPIVDDLLAFRVAGEVSRADGLIENRFLNTDGDPSKGDTFRAKLLATPWGPDGARILLSYLYARNTQGEPYSFSDEPDFWSDRTILSNRQTRLRSRTNLLTGDISVPLAEGFTLSSVTTYNLLDTERQYDGDLTPEDVAYGTLDSDQKIFSQELRLTVDRGPLQGLVGGYFSRQKNPGDDATSTFLLNLEQELGFTQALVDLGGLDPDTAAFIAGFYPEDISISSNQQYPLDVKTMALFGDATFALGDHIKLIGGFRYDRETQRVANSNLVVLNTELPDPALFPEPLNFAIAGVNDLLNFFVTQASAAGPQTKRTFEAFLPKAGISWEFADDKTLSFIVQRGYRSGGSGINPGRARIYSYDPEYTWNYEGSLRSQWLDRRLTLNANLFYIEWKDQQVSVQLSDNVYDYETRNAGKSRVWGFEVESSFQAANALSLYASLGYANTLFKEFTITDGTVQNLAGNEFADSPRWTASAGFDWRHEAGWSVNANVTHKSARYQFATVQTGRDIPSATLINFKAGWENQHFGAFLVGTNLFNDKHWDYRYVNVREQALLGEPRLIGITLEAHY